VIGLNDDGRSYAMILTARITGLATLVASGTAKVTSEGRSGARDLRSERFDIVTRSRGEEFAVKVGYKGGDVESFVVAPPIVNTIDRVAIERRHLTAVNDMLAAFVFKGDELDATLCERELRVFTGVERFDVTMRFVKNDEATSRRTGYQGPLVLCGLDYRPVSGHYTTSEITTYLAESDRILLWYAPLAAESYFIPYRAIVATASGDLSMVLTALEQ
jgi:hypothetical protein